MATIFRMSQQTGYSLDDKDPRVPGIENAGVGLQVRADREWEVYWDDYRLMLTVLRRSFKVPSGSPYQGGTKEMLQTATINHCGHLAADLMESQEICGLPPSRPLVV
jgi:hypothetical protein